MCVHAYMCVRILLLSSLPVRYMSGCVSVYVCVFVCLSACLCSVCACACTRLRIDHAKNTYIHVFVAKHNYRII